MPKSQTYYDLLEVPYDATRDVIRAAVKRKRSQFDGDPAMVRWVELAWAVLGDAVRKSEYDRENDIDRLRMAQDRLNRPPPTLVQQGQSPQQASGAFDIPKTEIQAVSVPPVQQSAAGGKPAVQGKESVPPQEAQPADEKTVVRPDEPPEAAPVSCVTIRIVPLKGRPSSQELAVGEYVIGRKVDHGNSPCNICFDDPEHYISRRHATLIVRVDGCLVRDEKSDNGTYVNGHPIPCGGTALLADGDQIEIEGRIVQVYLQGSAQEGEP